MNKIIIYFSITLISGLILTSCDYSDLDTYSGNNDIHFEKGFDINGDQEKNSKMLHIGYDNIKDSIITIPTVVIGDIKDFDRPINFSLIDSLSTGKVGEDVEFLFDKSLVEANSHKGKITIKLLETERSNTSLIKLTLKILPNEYFTAQYTGLVNANTAKTGDNYNIFRVYFDSNHDMPILWADAESHFKRIFGEYSKVKYKFILETLRFSEDLFYYDPEIDGDPKTLAESRFPSLASFAWIMLLNRTLNDYEKEHGERLKDENGLVVTFPLSFS